MMLWDARGGTTCHEGGKLSRLIVLGAKFFIMMTLWHEEDLLMLMGLWACILLFVMFRL